MLEIFFAELYVWVCFHSGLDEGLPCSYFHETIGLTEAQRIERYSMHYTRVVCVGGISTLVQELLLVLVLLDEM